MLLDERNDIIHLLLRWLEATFPILRDNELITTHPSALTVSTHIRRITQAISLVQMIPANLNYSVELFTFLICNFSRVNFIGKISNAFLLLFVERAFVNAVNYNIFPKLSSCKLMKNHSFFAKIYNISIVK